ERVSQKRALATAIQNGSRRKRKLFRVSISLLCEKHAGARVIELGDRAYVAHFYKRSACFVQCLQGLIVTAQLEQRHGNIILSARKITAMLCSFEMNTCSRMIEQRPIEILNASQPSIDDAALHIETSERRVVRYVVQQRCCPIQKRPGLIKVIRRDFDGSAVHQSAELIRGILRCLQR